MARVMMVVQYEIKASKVEKYKSLIEEMKAQYLNNENVNYSVFSQKGNPLAFTEIYTADSVEQFDRFEEIDDEATDMIVKKMFDCVGSKQKFITLLEN